LVHGGWWLVAVLASGAAAAACESAAPQPPESACEQVGRAHFLPSVPEASGIAYAGGVLWTHNDSAAPVLYSIDAAGRAMPVAVAGADVWDCEDLATGPCGGPASANATARQACLFIADIGDNQESRERITIYQLPVPASGGTSTKPATAIHVRYPDGPHDAEALVVVAGRAQLKLSPTMFVITKDLPARVYRFVAAADPGGTGTLTLSGTLNEQTRITGAAVSRDERWVALRSNRVLLLYTLDEFVNGGEPVRIDLRRFKEPQGEGVTFGSDADLYLVSEGGGKNAAGVLSRIHCAFLR
jgi:hypothetical protein